MRDYLMYMLARLAILLATVAVIWWIAGPGLISTIAAIVISALISYLALARLREASTEALIEWQQQRRNRKGTIKPRTVAKGSDEEREDQEIDRRS